MCKATRQHAADTRPAVPAAALSITRAAHDCIVSTLSEHACEAGGLLAQGQSGIIEAFRYDAAAGCGKGAYRPTPDWGADVCRQWAASGLRFAGFVHSHPSGYHALSPKDVACAQQFLRMNPAVEQLVMAIVCDAQLFLYAVLRDGSVQAADICIA